MADERIGALLGLIKNRLRIEKAGDLGEAAGRPPRADPSLERSWQRGAGVSSVYLLNMLSSAGLLQPEAEAIWRGVSRSEAERLVIEAREEAAEAEAEATRLVASGRRPRVARPSG